MGPGSKRRTSNNKEMHKCTESSSSQNLRTIQGSTEARNLWRCCGAPKGAKCRVANATAYCFPLSMLEPVETHHCRAFRMLQTLDTYMFATVGTLLKLKMHMLASSHSRPIRTFVTAFRRTAYEAFQHSCTPPNCCLSGVTSLYDHVVFAQYSM